ncbi:NAD-dependent protein deacetylase [Massilia sp. Bi118]|uniref:SIR2 family NAD-dependent protein deacylase n=1 Tax=Massilia sp. Bi118 TaxID=2822346 RepID=UPI001D846AB3|nr:Sir2 family NAD-dependent protein deacetylase [Massilia sp. Bi118]CAH0174782.1 NAD-dependent protein deacetylase [Massilia sp. Bi118]
MADIGLDAAIGRAARLLRDADALLIGAGAGIGVDSGLPDFRGDHGFWRAYPPLAKLGIRFVEIANPHSFARHPELAWGFYGHRLALYRDTVPHEGFTILRELGARRLHGAFVFTSNVDGQFQRAGFSDAQLVECHGSIHHLQCSRPCGDAIWPADAVQPRIDPAGCLMRPPLPACPRCGALARPNVLMFNDGSWLEARTEAQYGCFDTWLRQVEKLVVIELGAGTNVPSVRRMCESLGAPLIRINPREPEVPSARDIGFPAGALDTLRRLRDHLPQ